MRLTEKNKDYGLGYRYKGDYLPPMEQKLGQLEDIEDELGIELNVLFKALKYFWKLDDIDNNKKPLCIHYPFLRKNENCKKYEFVFNQQAFGDSGIRDAHIFYDSVLLEDYGKTWALTKEELK